MTTTTEQRLAAALRLVMASPDCNCGFQGCGSESQCARDRYNSAQGSAREALAAYDAQILDASKAGPWRVLSPALPAGNHWADHPPVIGLESGEVIAIICDESDSRASRLNERAAHIVKCVNAHDGLVAALQYAREWIDGCGAQSGVDTAMYTLDAALAAAGVQP